MATVDTPLAVPDGTTIENAERNAVIRDLPCTYACMGPV